MNRQVITTINGIEITAVQDENHNIFVPVKPICDAIGVAYQANYHAQGDGCRRWKEPRDGLPPPRICLRMDIHHKHKKRIGGITRLRPPLPARMLRGSLPPLRRVAPSPGRRKRGGDCGTQSRKRCYRPREGSPQRPTERRRTSHGYPQKPTCFLSCIGL